MREGDGGERERGSDAKQSRSRAKCSRGETWGIGSRINPARVQSGRVAEQNAGVRTCEPVEAPG